MSYKTWQAEYYPRKNRPGICSKKRALEASILKWRGLLKGALKKHKVIIQYGCVVESDELTTHAHNVLTINGSSCTLCHFYIENECEKCPLCIVRDGTKCGRSLEEEHKSPYSQFRNTNNARPMLRWLLKAQKRVEGKK